MAQPPPRVWEIYGNWLETTGFFELQTGDMRENSNCQAGNPTSRFFLSSFNKSKVMERDKLCILRPGWDGPQKDAEQSETWKCVANICKYHTYHLYKTILEALFDLSGCYCKAFWGVRWVPPMHLIFTWFTWWLVESLLWYLGISMSILLPQNQ